MSQQYPSSDQPPSTSYPQQLPPSPKRGFFRSPLGIGCGVLAVLIVLVIVIAIAINAGSGGTSANNSSSSNTANTPASGTASHVIGQVVTSIGWDVTVNKVSTSPGSQFDAPKAGDVFLVVNVTLKNTSSSAQTASSLAMFALKDSTGQTYTQDIGASGTPDGNVAPGGLVRGDVTYDVPKNITSYVLQFTPGLDASQLVEWSIKD